MSECDSLILNYDTMTPHGLYFTVIDTDEVQHLNYTHTMIFFSSY